MMVEGKGWEEMEAEARDRVLSITILVFTF